MKLVILDGYAENPGDLSWDALSDIVDEYEIYDITEPELVLERSLDADILVTNKTPITRQLIEKLPGPAPLSPLRYQITDGCLDRWVYSPPNYEKAPVETVFTAPSP